MLQNCIYVYIYIYIYLHIGNDPKIDHKPKFGGRDKKHVATIKNNEKKCPDFNGQAQFSPDFSKID